MKNLIVTVIICLMTTAAAFSQVGINSDGSSPDASSMLDVKSTVKGILIPRMTTLQRTSIPAPAEGLIVYDTDLGSLCFYRLGSWNQALGNLSGWSLKGNAGINPATDFLGTTDNNAVIFKMNNLLSGTINPASTFFGYTAGRNSTGINNTLIGSGTGWIVSSGSSNTALGYQALRKDTTGSYNTALGVYSLFYNTTGEYNVATGQQALYNNLTGTNNTANGVSSLNNTTTGGFNTAIGNSALYFNTTGYYNTALGSNSGALIDNATNITALGYNAQANASNQVRLGNANITSLFCIGAYFATSSANPNMTVDANGQIMRSTATLLSGTGTENQVTFWSGPGVLTSSDNLYWDNTNSMLGIGITAPNQQLELTGSFQFPATTSSTTGVIYKDGTPFIHDYKPATNNGSNTFVGADAGNFTMAGANAWEASYNTGIGKLSLNALTTGSDNTSVGYNTLKANIDGNYNTAMGSGALSVNTTGDGNSAIGVNVLDANISGGRNAGFGIDALTANTTGSNNTAVGASALAGNTIGTDNSAFGNYALQANTTAHRNTAIGKNALYLQSFSNGGVLYYSHNVAVGYNALYNNQPASTITGIGNTAVGNLSLDANVTGSYNTAIGYGSDVSAGTFSNSTAVGYNAVADASNQVRLGNSTIATLFCTGAYYGTSAATPNMTVDANGQIMRSTTSLPTGTGSTGQVTFWSSAGVLSGNNNFFWDIANSRLGIGTSAPNQQLELSGSFRLPVTNSSSTGIIFKGTDRFIHDYKASGTTGLNTFVGVNSGNFTMAGGGTQASFNTGIGYQALNGLTTGSDNTALGHFALNVNSSGINNTALGEQTLISNTIGGHNVAVGYGAILKSVSGSYNTAVGEESGRGTDANSFSNNALFGYRTGYNLTTGSNNILLGYQAGDALTSGSNNIVIGYNADAPSATANSQVVIGSQDLLYGDLTLYRIGIGTSAPGQKLELKGGNLLLSNIGNASAIMLAEPVSAGTNYTAIKAQNQATDITYQLPMDDGNPGSVLSSDGVGILSWITPNAGDITSVGSMISGDAFANATADDDWLGLGLTAGRIEFDDQATDEVNILAANVGIGTSTPSQQLEITGNFVMPATTASTGIIYSGANRFLHNYGTHNIFMGELSGNLSLAGSVNNISIGDSTLFSISSGDYNVAVGSSALFAVTTATGNTVVGNWAGISNISGGYNTIMGYQAGKKTTADRNTFIGCESGMLNSTGQYNVFLGHQSGYSNTTGVNSTGLGFRALFSQTGNASDNSLNNTAVGYEALYTNNPTTATDGRENVAVGHQALRQNQTGYMNSSIGTGALYTNTTGYNNTALGAYTLNLNSTGRQNTAIGTNVLSVSTTSYNTGVGDGALQFMTSGQRNTAVGTYALDQLLTGSDNTAVGYMANCDANNCINSVAIGYSASASASDQVRLGNVDITTLYCMGAYVGTLGTTNRDLFADNTGKIGYIASSARYKNNIFDMEDVDWLYDLRPVNFTYKSDLTEKKQYGLIAEEVEKVNPEFVSYNSDGSVETVSYSQLIAPMLKALQDQQAVITELQKRIEALETEKKELTHK
jgi:hypothetical protein